MRVRFIADPGPRDTPVGEHYEAGGIYDLRPDQVFKWVHLLGLAVEEVDPPAAPLELLDALVEAAEGALAERAAASMAAPSRPRRRA